ncbi:MAG: cysteine--tRNA ligase [Campylobacterales bacterium]|nr:cysteine--tRNA ligase [Campylobacterales bacterium]
MKLFLTDSRTKQKTEFIPQNKEEVTMYVCGPTVYDDAHLGHGRSSIAFDLLYRTLKAFGYKVKYVKNITDVDDKILKKMKETGQTLKELTEFYIDRYNKDMKALNVLDSDISPKATENINQMADLIQDLIDKGSAYQISNGDVYFNVSTDEAYGSLSKQTQDDVQNRITNSEKKDSRDFVLWKAEENKEEVGFDSTLGRGRPGWHIECSAMVNEFLGGDEFLCDIHGGGEDLFFPHHENEATQCRCGYGKEISKYWLHNGFVKIDGEKMSKSLGNSFFLKDALKVYGGEVIRFFLMNVHYRNDFNFNEEDLLASKKRLDRLYRLKKSLYGVGTSAVNKKFKEDLLNAMGDDLNISVALSNIDNFVTSSNEKINEDSKNKGLKKEIISNINFIELLLGVGGMDSYEYFQFGIDKEEKEKIEDLIIKRSEAKKNKNFEKADKIREEISKIGVTIMDTPNGTVWEKA